MASNTGKGYRQGAVTGRSQSKAPGGNYVRRNTSTATRADIRRLGPARRGCRWTACSIAASRSSTPSTRSASARRVVRCSASERGAVHRREHRHRVRVLARPIPILTMKRAPSSTTADSEEESPASSEASPS